MVSQFVYIMQAFIIPDDVLTEVNMDYRNIGWTEIPLFHDEKVYTARNFREKNSWN